MGRQAAGEAFMRGFVDHYGNTELDILLHTPKESRQAQAFLHQEYGFRDINSANMWDLSQLQNQTLYLPSPGIGEMAVHRAKFDERQFSLCGVTHTTATHRVMQTLSDLPIDPVRPWDALICTSSSVRQSVEVIVQERVEYLQWKLGVTRIELPQLPVIPLGVHCQDYGALDKVAARKSYNIASDDIVVVYVGRLSFHAKAHPHPMLVALEEAAKVLEPGRRVHLLQCGWFANEHIEKAFEQSQTQLSPNIVHHHIDGRIKAHVRQVWSAADIFISLSDNIQETFGLTPIEAMAAGLPVVVRDWNGYKDTIVHGETGYRVKTTLPSRDSVGQTLAERYATGQDTYDMYCGHSCETISVDIPETIHYLSQLFASQALRDQLGTAGKQRALARYDWSVIMRQYHDLWEQLDEIRCSHTNKFGNLPHKVMSHQIDPYRLFSHYPSVQLCATAQFNLNQALTQSEFERVSSLTGHAFAEFILPDFTLCQQIQQALVDEPKIKLGTLTTQLDCDPQLVEIAVSWLMKIGVLSIHTESL